MSSEGAYAHFKYPGELADQPAFDMDVFDIIKSRWCELRNQEMKAEWQAKK